LQQQWAISGITDIFSAANDALAAAAAEFKSAAAFKRPIRAASLDAACDI
jgi:hypothetical protein